MPDWQEIVAQDGPAVWRTGYRLLGNRADADECFQEALLAALEVSRREPVQHWRGLLQRLVAARSLDRLRQRRRRQARERTADWNKVASGSPPPAQAAEEAELCEHLRAALALLPEKQANAFWLHALEGWSYQEIARAQNVSIDLVGVLLYRARQRLRRLLGVGRTVDPDRSDPDASADSAVTPSQKEPL